MRKMRCRAIRTPRRRAQFSHQEHVWKLFNKKSPNGSTFAGWLWNQTDYSSWQHLVQKCTQGCLPWSTVLYSGLTALGPKMYTGLAALGTKMYIGLAALGTKMYPGLPALKTVLYSRLTALGPKMYIGLAALGTKMYPRLPALKYCVVCRAAFPDVLCCTQGRQPLVQKCT